MSLLPFVSRRSYEYMLDINAARIEDLKKTLEAEREHNRYLTSELLKLKRDGFAQPVEQQAYESPMSQFGPLTRTALNDMSIGQSGIVKRKMREKATMLWLEQRGQENQDEVVAIAVRKGETG